MPKKNSSPIILKNKDEKLYYWKRYVQWGQAFKDKYYTKNAERWKNYFKGVHWPNQDALSTDARIVVNYTYSITKAIVPQIYFQDPYFYVNAEDPAFEPGQTVTEAVLNDTWRTMKAKKQVRRVVQDFLVMSFGVAKQGYKTKFVRDYSTPDSQTGLDYTEFIEEEAPWMVRVSPQEIIFDPEAKHFDELRWLAIPYILPVLQAKSEYNNLDSYDEDIYGTFSKQFGDAEMKIITDEDKSLFARIKVWEIHDFVDNRIMTMSEEVDKWLKDVENPYDFKSAVTIYSPNDVPDELYPISDIAQIADLNWELDQVRTQMMNHRKKMQRKILAEHGAFPNQKERDKFLSGEDMQMVVVTDGAISQNKIMVVDASGISPSFYQYGDQIVNDMNNISAVGANQRATDNESEKTATEASIIDKNMGLRNSERLDYMAEWCVDVATKVLRIQQKFGGGNTFWSEKLKGWIQWAQRGIAGKYNISIHMGATQRRSEEQERSMLQQNLPSIMGMVDRNGQPACNQPELFRYLFSKYGMTEDEIKRIIYPENSQPPMPPNMANTPPQGDDNAMIAQILGGMGNQNTEMMPDMALQNMLAGGMGQ